jgi:hypothetical protein
VPVAAITAAPQPATLVLLVDATASMPLHLLDLAPAVASGVVGGLRTGDHVRLGVISGNVRFGGGFTDDARAAVGPLISFFTRGEPEPSPIWDAIDAASALLENEHGVRAIAVITDGKATGNRLGFDEMEANVLRRGVSVHAIAEAPEVIVNQQGAKVAASIHPSASLHELAETTGGSYLVDGPGNVVTAPRMNLAELDAYRDRTKPQTDALIREIFARVRRTYSVTIDVPSDQVLHRLDVRVRENGATVQAPRMIVGGQR